MIINEDNFQIPSQSFESIITMPSQDFQKICRDMHNLSDTIEIKSVGNSLILNWLRRALFLTFLLSIPTTSASELSLLDNTSILFCKSLIPITELFTKFLNPPLLFGRFETLKI